MLHKKLSAQFYQNNNNSVNNSGYTNHSSRNTKDKHTFDQNEQIPNSPIELCQKILNQHQNDLNSRNQQQNVPKFSAQLCEKLFNYEQNHINNFQRPKSPIQLSRNLLNNNCHNQNKSDKSINNDGSINQNNNDNNNRDDIGRSVNCRRNRILSVEKHAYSPQKISLKEALKAIESRKKLQLDQIQMNTQQSSTIQICLTHYNLRQKCVLLPNSANCKLTNAAKFYQEFIHSIEKVKKVLIIKYQEIPKRKINRLNQDSTNFHNLENTILILCKQYSKKIKQIIFQVKLILKQINALDQYLKSVQYLRYLYQNNLFHLKIACSSPSGLQQFRMKVKALNQNYQTMNYEFIGQLLQKKKSDLAKMKHKYQKYSQIHKYWHILYKYLSNILAYNQISNSPCPVKFKPTFLEIWDNYNRQKAH